MARNTATAEATDAPKVPDVLKGVTTEPKATEPTPPGDAKEQARQARRDALLAKKAEIAAKAAGNGSAPKLPATPKVEDEPKDEPKDTEEPSPAPQPKLTVSDKLRELLAVSDGRTDHKAAKEQLRSGIQAILDDLKTAPRATQAKTPKATSPEGLAMEAAALKLLSEQASPTMGDFHKEVGAASGDPKPRAAMDRLIKAGKVEREKVEGKVVYHLVSA